MENKSAKTRAHIIEQAAVVFNEKGISATSIDDILRAANVSKGCLYGHFESKEELSEVATDFVLDKMTERRTQQFAKCKSAKDKLFAFMDMNKNPLQSFIPGGCPIVNLSTEADDTNPKIKKKLKTMISESVELFAGIIKEGIVNKEFSDQINPEELANKIFLAVEGGNAICRVLSSTKPMQMVINNLKSELESYLL